MWLARGCVFFILLASASQIRSQQADFHNKQQYVVVPSDIIMLAVAAQPDCPLAIENAKLLKSADGNSKWGVSYSLRNVGSNPIKTFTAVIWTSDGAGGTLERPTQLQRQFLLPGQVIKADEEDVISLTDELRKKLGLQPPMRAIAVVMIEKVLFADGSIYVAETTSQALLNYFESLPTIQEKSERQSKSRVP